MQEDVMKRKITGWVLLMLLLSCLLCGCGVGAVKTEKIRDVDYTVLESEEIPDDLLVMIEEKKQGEFKLTYQEDGYLYIARGYGMQETGGYSIQVDDLYLTENAVCFGATLIGPKKEEHPQAAVSYPYVVVKTEGVDKTVVFEN